MYIHILLRLRDAVRRKRPEEWRTKISFHLDDNAPGHRSVLVKDFLAENNVKTLEYPPYSPDLAPADFLPAVKGRGFCDATGIINPLNPELNPICYLLALLGAHHFHYVSRIRAKLLTFRLLMSYIYIYIYIYMCVEHPFLMFLDHTQRRGTVGRTPLDE